MDLRRMWSAPTQAAAPDSGHLRRKAPPCRATNTGPTYCFCPGLSKLACIFTTQQRSHTPAHRGIDETLKAPFSPPAPKVEVLEDATPDDELETLVRRVAGKPEDRRVRTRTYTSSRTQHVLRTT